MLNHVELGIFVFYNFYVAVCRYKRPCGYGIVDIVPNGDFSGGAEYCCRGGKLTNQTCRRQVDADKSVGNRKLGHEF